MREALGFGAGDVFGGGQLVLIPTYLALFWTRFCGMGIDVAQAIIGVSALVSAFAALAFGVLDDNLYRFRAGIRFGRRRLMLACISPLILVGVLLWIPGLPVTAYALVYVGWVMLVQAFQACYNPLPGEMTQDFGQRTKLSTVRLVISTAAGTAIPVVGSWALAVLGEYQSSGYMVIAIGSTLAFSLAVAVTWRSVWEMTPEQAGFGAFRDERFRLNVGWRGWWRRCAMLLREYATTLRIKEFRTHVAIYVLVQCSMDVFGQTFVFFVVYDWGRTASFASLLLGCTVISLPLMPLFGWLMTKLGPRRLYAVNFVGMLVGLAAFAALWLCSEILPAGLWNWLAVIAALWFFTFKSLCGYLPWAVFPFIADVDQIVTRRYRAATFSGIQACLRQMASGISALAVGMVLHSVGFDASLTHQSQRARLGIGIVMLGWFAMAMILCWVVSRRLTISRNTDGLVLREIDRLRNGGKKRDVERQSKRIIEQLTGLPYDEWWK